MKTSSQIKLIVSLMVISCMAFGQERMPDKLARPKNPPPLQAPAPAAKKPLPPKVAKFPRDLRSYDGRDNNLVNPTWGNAESEYIRNTTVGYEDGADAPAGADRPSPRAISNACATQEESIPNRKGASDFLWQWGQFLDHDIDMTPSVSPAEPFNIAVPAGDPYFDPNGTGTVTIPLNRSLYRIIDGIREQVNGITAYIDASQVYGSDAARATALRTLDGTGRLKTSDQNLLPFNTDGITNLPTSGSFFFVAGDVRANEQVGLIAMHTLFVREHNYWADRVRSQNPMMAGDEIYEAARAIVAAEIQAITYREFLPILLGRNALRPYNGYNPRVNAGISNVFAAAAYRVGHTMLSSTLLRLDHDGNEIANGNLTLAGSFFNLAAVVEDGIDPILRGMAHQVCQEIDMLVIDDVRNFLFGQPGSGGFDLASLNIQRGRDHGLPGYNQVRRDLRLRPAVDFSDISANPEVQDRLAAIYENVEQIDVWVGGLAEDHLHDALVGETFYVILKDQFERLRDGDRFWYQSYLPADMVRMVEHQTLAKIIRRNTDIGNEISDRAFIAAPRF